MLDYLIHTPEWNYLGRLLFAAVCGFIIGFERKIRYKEAGVRTHTIVSIGACLIMEISKYGFADTGGQDTSRIAAQIVSGIGFLGAGMILYKREALRGLTTAAGIWVTAGVGMCVGAGMYLLSLGATVIVVASHLVFHLPLRIFRSRRYQIFMLDFEADKTEEIEEIFHVTKFDKVRTYWESDGTMRCSVKLKTWNLLTSQQVCVILEEHRYIRTIERLEDD